MGFYTTRIIYKPYISCYDKHVIKRKAERKVPGKEKDMTTMNRLYCSYRESYLAYLEESEMGLCFMHSSIDKQKRGNCV